MADAVLTLEAKFIDHVTTSIRSIQSQMERMEHTVHESSGKIRDDLAKMNEQAKKGDGEFTKFASSMGRWALSAAGAYISFQGLKSLIGGSISEAREAAQVQRELAAQIEATGRGSEITVQELTGLGDSLSKVTDFEDDAIAKAAGLLVQFNRLGAESIPRVTESALNLAKRFGMDASSAALLLGKALQDPDKGLNQLNRQFRLFDEGQVTALKRLMDTGRGMEAQRRILDALDKKYGGFARNAADPFLKFKNAIDETKEAIGTSLMPTLTTLMQYVASDVIPFWEQAASGLKKFVIESFTMQGIVDRVTRKMGTGHRGMGDLKSAERDAGVGAREIKKQEERRNQKDFGGPTSEEIRKKEDEELKQSLENAKIQAAELDRIDEERLDRKREIDAMIADLDHQETVRAITEAQIRAKAVSDLENKRQDLAIQTASTIADTMTTLAGENKALFLFTKSLAIAEVIVNTARAIGTAMAAGPFGIPLIPFYQALGAAQIASIAATTVQGFAQGTLAAPGGAALVGENGPELVNLPRGSRVFNNTETRNIMGGGNINAPLTIVVHGGVNQESLGKIRDISESYVDQLKKWKRMEKDAKYLNVPEF